MALSVYNTDTFIRANSEIVGATMSDGLGVWASRDNATGIHSVTSNKYFSSAGSWNNVPIFNTNMSSIQGDQAAEVKILSLTNAGGPVVRYSSGTYYYISGLSASTCSVINGAAGYPGTTIATFTGLTIAVNDLIKLEAIGTLITVYINGSAVGNVTDSAYSTGRCGIWAAFSQNWGTYTDYIPAVASNNSGFFQFM